MIKGKKSGKSTDYLPIGVFLITSIFYVNNLSNSVYGGDSGDFLAASIVNGIPHPSGYPLYTMIGIVFMKVIPFGTLAFKFGLFSSIISSVGVAILYLTIRNLTQNRFLSLTSALTVAFSFPFWLYAEVVEVIALHNFFIILLLYLTTIYIQSKQPKDLLWLAFAAGLSLTNNLSALLLFPGIFVALLLTNKKLFLNFKLILTSIVSFLLGLVPYAYIPIAALKYPPINNGYAVNFRNFIHLATRQYYGWENSSELDSNLIINNFRFYGDYWHLYLNWTVLVFCLLGAIQLLKSKKVTHFWIFFITIILVGPFFIFLGRVEFTNFANLAVLEKFYPQTIILASYFLPFGFLLLREGLTKYLKNPFSKWLVFGSISLMALVQPASFIYKNYKRINLNSVYVGNYLGRDILQTAEEGSIVFLTDDSFALTALYNQYGLGFRKDIIIPGNYNGFDVVLRGMQITEEEVQGYKVALKGHLQPSFTQKVTPFLIKKHPVYGNDLMPMAEIDAGEIIAVPFGLLYKYYYKHDFTMTRQSYIAKVDGIFSKYQIAHFKENEDLISEHLYLAHIRQLYSAGYIRTGEFIISQYGDLKSAQHYFDLAKSINPVLADLNK